MEILLYAAIGLGGLVIGALATLIFVNVAVGFGMARALW